MATILLNKTGAAQNHSAPSPENNLKTPVMVTKGGKLEQAGVIWDFLFNKPENTRPIGDIPVQALSRQQLIDAPNNTVYRLGHSTVLMKLHDSFWISPNTNVSSLFMVVSGITTKDAGNRLFRKLMSSSGRVRLMLMSREIKKITMIW